MAPPSSANKGDDNVAQIHVQPKSSPDASFSPSTTEAIQHSDDVISPVAPQAHGSPEVIGSEAASQDHSPTFTEKTLKSKSWFRYFRTKEFWIVLVLGQVLSLCITSTNTFSSLLANAGTNIPAFQTFFNYVLLNIVYTSFTVYKYGPKGWAKMVWKDGWRYFLFAFCDVEGNYFTVLAYRYTTILSAQLINFWAIVIVVVISLIFLHVRYRITQYIGILVCVGGMGILLASDHITGSNGGPAADPLKGDLFALLGASFYGLGNVLEEFLVSKRPIYEVIGQLSFWAMLINGTQAGIFDRASFRTAVWDSSVGGYLTGYTLILALFYSLAPVLFRLASAAFFNISLLTANFWGTAIGTQVFGLSVHWMYPIAFVLIILGLGVYFAMEGRQGEAVKPWLGKGQTKGVEGVGTAKGKVDENETAGGINEDQRQGEV